MCAFFLAFFVLFVVVAFFLFFALLYLYLSFFFFFFFFFLARTVCGPKQVWSLSHELELVVRFAKQKNKTKICLAHRVAKRTVTIDDYTGRSSSRPLVVVNA